MSQATLLQYLAISLVTGLVALIVKLFSQKLNKSFHAKWKYWVWLVLALRLLIPIGIALPKAPITITLPEEPPAIMAQAAHTETPVGDQPTAVSLRNGMSIENILTAVWLFGCAFFLGRQLLCYHLHRKRLLRWSIPMQNQNILALTSMERYILGISRDVEILECRAIQSPTMVGFFRPKLLLPTAVHSLTSYEMVFVLRHELTHLKRNDLWYKLLLVCATAMHWYNPAVHLMLHEASADLEISCDAEVVRSGDAHMRQVYSETILTFLSNERRGIMLATHFNGGAKAMKERLTILLSATGRRKGAAAFLALLLAAIMGGSLVGAPLAEWDEAAQLIQTWKALYEGDDGWTPNPYNEFAPQPDADDISQEEALRLAMETVMKATGTDISVFDGYRPYFSYDAFVDGRHEWSVSFYEANSTTELLPYTIVLDALTGKIQYYQYGGRG